MQTLTGWRSERQQATQESFWGGEYTYRFVVCGMVLVLVQVLVLVLTLCRFSVRAAAA